MIDSCTNTSIDRILATCAQHAITITGNLPAINTFIRRCDLTSECRAPGLDTHEAIYNLVIEDCVLGTAALNGVTHINRCRIISNRRFSTGEMSISVYGSQNPEWSKIVIENTKFEGVCGIELLQSGVQSPVQAFDNVYGDIRFENCEGGYLAIVPETNATILSNTIQNLTIKNWKNCRDIYVSGTWRAKKFALVDSTFTENKFITDRNSSNGVRYDLFDYIDIKNTFPLSHKTSVCRTSFGENVVLPENVPIQLSSNSQTAKFVVCGSNLTSDNIDDYCVGSVGGSAGGTLTRSIATGANAPTIAFNGNGDLVYSQGSGSTGYCFYPVGMFYTNEYGTATISCKIKDTGNASGSKFRPAIAMVDCETGKLIDRYFGSTVTVSSTEQTVTFEKNAAKGRAVLCYFYCSSAVSGSETTFSDYSVKFTPKFAPPIPDSDFSAHRLTGNGTVLSLRGVNNIMCSETTFSVKYEADLTSM